MKPVLNHPISNRVLVAAISLTLVLVGLSVPVASQAPTPTPLVVQLASPTPLPVLGANATNTPLPTPTETPIGPVQVQVAEGQGNINVRREADPNSDILGVIAPGESYAVTGRFFRWIQFRFPNSPNGLGYVYDELVTLVGDVALIPDLTVVTTPPAPTSEAGADLGVTAASVDAEFTLTADSRVLNAPVGVDPNATLSETSLNPQGGVRLPTYTPLPNLGEILSAANQVPTETPVPDLLDLNRTASNLPPILPIAILGGLGLLGLLLSGLRRG
jgi:hypothetical protein